MRRGSRGAATTREAEEEAARLDTTSGGARTSTAAGAPLTADTCTGGPIDDAGCRIHRDTGRMECRSLRSDGANDVCTGRRRLQLR